MTFQEGDPGHVTEHNTRKTASDAEHNNDGTHKLIASAPHVAATDPHGDRAHSDAADSAHVAASDPHNSQARVDTHNAAATPHTGKFDTFGAASTAVTTHTGASDPHGDRAAASSALTTHEASSTDHPQRTNYAPTGLSGAQTGGARFVGFTQGGPPTSGTFLQGDYVVDNTTLTIWLCSVGGTPGTWVDLSSGRQLAIARFTAANTFALSSSVADVTGCTITFTAPPGPFIVHAKATANFTAGTAPNDVNLYITDNSNNILETAPSFMSSTGRVISINAWLPVDATSGSVTYKLRANCTSGNTSALTRLLSGVNASPIFIRAQST